MDERACVALSKKTVSSLFRTTFYAFKVIVLNKDASQDGGVLAICAAAAAEAACLHDFTPQSSHARNT